MYRENIDSKKVLKDLDAPFSELEFLMWKQFSRSQHELKLCYAR
tara:strand:- start:819 stop:950 length:132 start_codon:yes stop_codon:yes gene_type:complete